jgi:hypothetical protein
MQKNQSQNQLPAVLAVGKREKGFLEIRNKSVSKSIARSFSCWEKERKVFRN